MDINPYPISNFGGVRVVVVPTGTVVTDERTGQKQIITDQSSAGKGDLLWVTQATFDRMNALLDAKGSG